MEAIIHEGKKPVILKWRTAEMENWKIILTQEVDKKVETFLAANPGKAADVEGLLADIRELPHLLGYRRPGHRRFLRTGTSKSGSREGLSGEANHCFNRLFRSRLKKGGICVTLCTQGGNAMKETITFRPTLEPEKINRIIKKLHYPQHEPFH